MNIPSSSEQHGRIQGTHRLPRVLFVVAMDPSQKLGSIEEHVSFLTRLFGNRGSLFLPLFICSHAPRQPTPLERAGVPIECLDLSEFSFSVFAQLLRVLRHQQIDLIHWNFTPPLRNSYLWWLTLLRPGITHYYTDHISRLLPLPDPARSWKSACKRLLLKRYAKVLCVSEFVLECLKRENTWSNFFCCRHVVNTSRFRSNSEVRARIRAAHQVGEGFVVLTVAQLIKEKGIAVLLHALSSLPENVVLWIVGSGVEADTLQRLADDLGVSQRVTFHGSQEQVEPYMQGADCFVCPSLWAEAAGLVTLEAQSSGLPTVASNVGGIPEYVADGKTGFLFSPGNATQLADRIRQLLTDTALRARLGRTARAMVEKEFSPEARLDELLAIYQP